MPKSEDHILLELAFIFIAVFNNQCTCHIDEVPETKRA